MKEENDYRIYDFECEINEYEKCNNHFIKVKNLKELEHAQLWWKEKGFELYGSRAIIFPFYIGVINNKLEIRNYETLKILRGIKIIDINISKSEN